MLSEMPKTSGTGRLTHPALALGACLHAVGEYPLVCFFFPQLYDLVSPAHELIWEQTDAEERTICKWKCFCGWCSWLKWSWGSYVERKSYLAFLELNYQEQPVVWKKKGWGERKQVVRGYMYQRSGALLVLPLQSPLLFLPLEVVVIPSALWRLEKKFGIARSKYAENCCAVRELRMKVYNWDAWGCLRLSLALKFCGA